MRLLRGERGCLPRRPYRSKDARATSDVATAPGTSVRCPPTDDDRQLKA
jgi:hypothetical protein